jgi:PhnB protein
VAAGRAQIAFLETAFDAKIVHGPVETPDDRVGHTELMIGDSKIMLGEPPDGNHFPSMVFIAVSDCDAAFQRMLDAGAETVMPPTDMGDCRQGGAKDSNGNQWWVGTVAK